MARNKAWSMARATAAIELRLVGYTYDEVAEELGYASKSGAYNAVNRTLTARQDAAVDEYRMETLARLDYMQGQVWSHVHRGDKRAIETSRKIAKQRLQVLRQEGSDFLIPKPKEPIVNRTLHEDHEHFHML
jgi:predicted transcriptional regulator